MEVIRLTDEHQKQYSEYVAAHKSGSFLQSWSWGEFQSALGKQAVRYGIFAEHDNANNNDGGKKLIGTVQLLQTKIPRLPGTYLYAPYAPLVNDDVTDAARELIAQVKIDFARAWFIRLEPKDELPIDGKHTLHIQPGSTLVTDLSLDDDALLALMHPKTRYNIKVAAKHEVTVISQALPMTEAINLLAKTSERQGYKSHLPAYYEQLLNYFAGQNKTDVNANEDCRTLLYMTNHNGQCIAAAIMVDHGFTRTYLFGGSENSQRNLMAPYALHWQAIQDAKQAGLTSYDWWGAETASGTTPGFVQFKMRWGGTQKFYAGAKDIVLNSKWYHAYNALRKVNRFF